MIISIVNRSAKISDAEVQNVIRAINRQIAEDFEPYWSFGATLRLEGAVGTPNAERLAELRGDAVIYLWDKTNVDDALGYHDSNARGIPYGFVFTELSKQLGENWTVTLSHEALELLGDAQGNLLVQGPHPAEPNVEVFHWFEMCDAVQEQTYSIDGIEVSNFVLPLYFTAEEQVGGRNDFLAFKNKQGQALKSFGVSPGGYVGFFDPRRNKHETWSAPDDAKAQKRIKIKTANTYGRGYLRKRAELTGAREDLHRQALAGKQIVRASATPSSDPIKHVVVLMMENRSFDQMLGDFKRINPGVEGIDRSKPRSNKTTDGRSFVQEAIAQAIVKRDADHEYAGVQQQLGSASAPMSGFAESYRLRYPDASDAELKQVMAYFPFGDQAATDSLPALHALARNFSVCDHWFSSLPGPTWPNRFFVHSATCLGEVLMPSKEDPFHLGPFYQDTIFERLSDANIDWRIYHDGIPQSIVLTGQLKYFLTGRGYDSMENFFAQAQGDASAFPEYAFIEPAYFGTSENDQHPPSDVYRGDELIASVYNALRQNSALWESTLLVVLYDEHGGFFDHVPPPATVAPDNHDPDKFSRLGVRVPAILASPWLDAGVIDTVFDHTSLLRYLCEKWQLPPLGERMQTSAGKLQANSLGAALRLRTAPRQDTPAQIGAAAKQGLKKAKATAETPEPPIEGSREALLLYIDKLPGGTAAGDKSLRAAASKGAKANRRAKVEPSALTEAAALAKLAKLRHA